jgi:hypothetical protein
MQWQVVLWTYRTPKSHELTRKVDIIGISWRYDYHCFCKTCCSSSVIVTFSVRMYVGEYSSGFWLLLGNLLQLETTAIAVLRQIIMFFSNLLCFPCISMQFYLFYSFHFESADDEKENFADFIAEDLKPLDSVVTECWGLVHVPKVPCSNLSTETGKRIFFVVL